MKETGLGINFDQMIDTDTGMLVTEDTPIVEDGDKSKEQHKEEEQENLIEVNVEETVQETSTDEGTQTVEESSSLPFKVLANALYEKGVLSELDAAALEGADEDEAELLIGLIKKEIDSNVNSYKTNLPSVIKELIDNYEENVPLDRLIGLKSQEMRLDGITEDSLKENPDLMKAVIQDNYKRAGFSDAKIAKRIQQFEDLDQLEDEAIEALSDIKTQIAAAQKKEKEDAKIRTKKLEEERTSNLNNLKKDINSTTELISGLKISDREKDIIYDSMTKVVETDSNGNPLNSVMVTRSKNPMGFEKLLHYYHSIGLFNIDDDGNINPDVSKIKAGAKASAMDSLTSALKKRQSSSSGTPVRTATVDSEKMKANLAALKNAIS